MVVEVSSFQLEHICDFRPRVSVHLNLTPDHLDRYKSMEEYEAAKWEIFRNQTPDDVAIVNTNLRLPPIRAKRVTISAAATRPITSSSTAGSSRTASRCSSNRART